MVKKSRTAIFISIILVFIINIHSDCQTTKDKYLPDIYESMDFKGRQAQQIFEQAQRTALEGTIDPEKYFVGPSDKIAINIWIGPPVSFNLTVTPEGTLIIPTVGEVKVSDITLAEVKKIVLTAVKKKYIANDVSITLIEPRPIIVTVSGNVLNSALYTLSSIDRADRAIQAANKLEQRQTYDELNDILRNMSTRNIVLKRRDGTMHRVDIPKFLATKEDIYNPYLREGDIVIVTRKNPVKNVIGVYGEVNNPNRFEFVEGDLITDAIKIAYGFTRLANIDSIEFSRLSEDGKILTTELISYEDILSGAKENFTLEPGDRLVIKSKLELREDFRVFLDGEVKYPGTHPITKNTTKLSEIINQAGGFTEYASLKMSEVYRRSVSYDEINIERIMSMRGSVSPDDSASYLIETELRLQKEIVNVDFEKLFNNKDVSQDIILKDGDYIRIPSTKRTIYVFGQVVSPGHIPLVKDASLDYYISKCGGLTDAARKGDVRIIKGKTKQWLDPDETTIEEGDHIWVPKKPERTFAYYTTVLSQTASILSVVTGMAFIIIQLTK
ncbi:MAG: SLBB domain-containing protein [Bacteroidota bacterium]|nr:SLBB domain-containing protein [Bacteroidota bacterium]